MLWFNLGSTDFEYRLKGWALPSHPSHITCPVVLFSLDACLGVWKCDSNHTEDVLQMVPLSHENKGSEGLHTCPSPAPAAQAEDARIFPNNLVSQQWNRFKWGNVYFSCWHFQAESTCSKVKSKVLPRRSQKWRTHLPTSLCLYFLNPLET